MKKSIISIILIFNLTNSCWAQTDEPEAINAKDLMEKLDRSDIEESSSDSKINNIMPEFEIPKIEFNEKLESKKVKKPTKVAKKPKLEKVQALKKSPKQSKQVVAEKSSNTGAANETVKPKVAADKVKKTETTKNKVVISKKVLKFIELNKNDKIVINKGTTYVYRLLKTKIIQYTYGGKLPLDSAGLKASGENSYYIVNKMLLMRDIKSKKSRGNKRAVTKKVKTSAPNKKSVVKPVVKPVVAEYKVTPEIAAQRKVIEGKYNHGQLIKKNFKLKDLQINDNVYVFDEVQLITRRQKSSSGIRKYWLIEKLDINNKAVKAVSRNKYTIIKRYQSN
jgi:hypothetical protein